MRNLSKRHYCYLIAALLVLVVGIIIVARLLLKDSSAATNEVNLSSADNVAVASPSASDPSAADISSSTGIRIVSIEKDPFPADATNSNEPNSKAPTGTDPSATSTASAAAPIDNENSPFKDRKPNEVGTVMIHLLHRFISEYEGGDKSVTMTLDSFRAFLQKLYDQGYRPVSMDDYLSNNISLPVGCMPTILTFDDGWGSQFQFIEENGKLVVDPNTAVGVWMKFNEEHPDFELRGVFYLNLGRQTTFGDKGTLTERLQYLIDLGFELGNHTYTHENLRELSAEEVLLQVGKNEAALREALPNYHFRTLALPFGNYRPDILPILAEGEYEGVSYKNEAVFLAGADPTHTPANANFNIAKPLARILAPGIEDVFMDSTWWLENQSMEKQYISDGNPNTLTVPPAKLEQLDPAARERWEVIVGDDGSTPAESAEASGE